MSPLSTLNPEAIPSGVRRAFDVGVRYGGRIISVFSEASVPQLAAAVSFFTLLAAGPLILVLLSIVGAIFGDDAAHGRVFAELRSLTGAESARTIEGIVERAGGERSNLWALGGTLLFLFSASGIFGQVSTALDTIRKAASGGRKPATTPQAGSKWRQAARGGWRLVRDRLVSMAMVLLVSLLLVLSIIASSVISVMTRTLDAWIDRGAAAGLLNFLVSMVMLSALSAALYLLLTRPPLPKLSAALGGVVAASLFLLLRWLVGLVVPLWASESSFGPAASVVTLLLWAWFSATTLLIGGLVASVHAEEQAAARDGRAPPAAAPKPRSDDELVADEAATADVRLVDEALDMVTPPSPTTPAASIASSAAGKAP